MLTLAVVVPLFGSILLPVAGRFSERARNGLAILCALCSLACVASLAPAVLQGRPVSAAILGIEWLRADALAVFMALISMSVGTVIVAYSFGYIAHYANRDEYYFLVLLFLGAMMGLVFSRNLIALYAFWEITAIACWRLIGFFRSADDVRRADKAFLVTVFGAALMLAGFVAIYAQRGTFDLQALRGTRLPDLAVALILCGILSKSATLPLHGWLPDAGVAPAPVTALLHAAVLVKIGVYVFARLFIDTFEVDPIWRQIVPWIAAASALVSAGAALVSNDLKRIIAYSTVSQLGFILLGLSVGARMALGGALLYLLMHGLAKAGLFLCAGVVEQSTHCKDIRKLGGLARTMPVTAASFALCALSVMGVPPLGGFFAKVLVLTGTLSSGHVAAGLAFVAGSFLTILYLLRAFSAVFLGEGAAGGPLPREGTRGMVSAVAAMAALSVAGGLLIRYPARFADETVRQMEARP